MTMAEIAQSADRTQSTEQDQDKVYPSHRRILIVTDAWEPQVNGVVTTVKNLTRQLRKMRYKVFLLTPNQFPTVPSFYPDVRLSIPLQHEQFLDRVRPDRIMIVTEGPLGLATKAYCEARNIPYSTSLTTKWPEYFQTHIGFPPLDWGYKYLQWFHNPAQATLVATSSLKNELAGLGFERLVQWNRGVDLERFKPLSDDDKAMFLPDKPRPFFLYVGRVSQEKNIQAFLDADLPGTKVVVGQGPHYDELKEAYTDVEFLGMQQGEMLRECVGGCDVMVFPSKTDTFGLVMLEAMACGLPVVAYQVTGPKDVFPEPTPVAFLVNEDEPNGLEIASQKAWNAVLNGDVTAEMCCAYANRFTWEQAAIGLLNAMAVIERDSENEQPKTVCAPSVDESSSASERESHSAIL